MEKPQDTKQDTEEVRSEEGPNIIILIVLIIGLMFLFLGEPDLFDSIRNFLVRYLDGACSR